MILASPKDKYCQFLQDHKHNTFECYDLKQQIEALIKQGKLQHFVGREKVERNPSKVLKPNGNAEECPRAPLREIRVIVKGTTMAGSFRTPRKTYLYTVQSVQIMVAYLSCLGWTTHPLHSPKKTFDDSIICMTMLWSLPYPQPTTLLEGCW